MKDWDRAHRTAWVVLLCCEIANARDCHDLPGDVGCQDLSGNVDCQDLSGDLKIAASGRALSCALAKRIGLCKLPEAEAHCAKSCGGCGEEQSAAVPVPALPSVAPPNAYGWSGRFVTDMTTLKNVKVFMKMMPDGYRNCDMEVLMPEMGIGFQVKRWGVEGKTFILDGKAATYEAIGRMTFNSDTDTAAFDFPVSFLGRGEGVAPMQLTTEKAPTFQEVVMCSGHGDCINDPEAAAFDGVPYKLACECAAGYKGDACESVFSSSTLLVDPAGGAGTFP